MSTEQYQQLTNCVAELVKGNVNQAQQQLNQFVEREIDFDADPEEIVSYLFAKSLLKRIEPAKTAEINLYLQNYEIPQIQLFNLFADSIPVARVPGEIANQLLVRLIEGKESIAMCNIGIGTGRQELALLQELKNRNQLPKKITLYAIEPSEQSLTIAQQMLEEAAQELHLELEFHPFVSTIEDLSEKDWSLIERNQEPLFINAAFALHHIRDQDGDQDTRNQILRKIHTWRPSHLVICEPYSNHYTEDLQVRFFNCWNHFSLLFRLIHSSSLTKQEKLGLKIFFSREIEDILGNTEESRTEKHETAEAWLERFSQAGYVPSEIVAETSETRIDSVDVKWKDGYLSVEYEGETIVSILCLTPAKR